MLWRQQCSQSVTETRNQDKALNFVHEMLQRQCPQFINMKCYRENALNLSISNATEKSCSPIEDASGRTSFQSGLKTYLLRQVYG